MACEELQSAVTTKLKALVATLTQKSKELGDDIQQKAKGIDPDIDTTGLDAWVGLDIDIKWKRVDFSLDLPEVKMVDQRWSLDLPQVTVSNQEIVFSTPSIRMKRVQTGEYPETVCKMVTKDVGFGVKIDVPECTVLWKPIYIDVPEPFMQEQRIVIGIPEFRMDRTEFVLGVPEFTMRRQDFSLDLPDITVKNINVEARTAQEKGEALSRESQARAAKLQEEFRENAKLQLGYDVTSLFDCYQQDLTTKKNDALHRFSDGISLLQNTITSMTANKVPDNDPNLMKVKTSLADLTSKRDSFAKEIEQKFVDLAAQQKGFFEKLMATA
ncbi:MAG: hypothetical protein EKK40_05785 [Bradyrhizobiaceae bacterium]|nr:MAG: hypothetical protein EKK40_05785 [Bradyrhizobiaceae bacterium]